MFTAGGPINHLNWSAEEISPPSSLGECRLDLLTRAASKPEAFQSTLQNAQLRYRNENTNVRETLEFLKELTERGCGFKS